MKQVQEKCNPRHQQVFLLMLLVLLMLRIPFMAGMRFFGVQRVWMFSVYEIISYLLILFLILWEIEHLDIYHIDTLSIIVIILFKPLQLLILKYTDIDRMLVYQDFVALIIWSSAIVFSILIWLNRSKLPQIKPVNLGWMLIGVLAGLITTVILSIPMSFQIAGDRFPGGLSVRGTLAQIPLSFIYQIGYAAVLEEPLFRGFLWGCLRKLNWHGLWIWLFQAGVFTVSHIYYLNLYPILFWITVPVSTLMLGWLAWRSKSITPSIFAHGIMNATGYAFGYLVSLYRFGY
jgi:membrane protease YdiL (CAAX protease family)